jgi:small nuclear ribonucleoprotein (snRNP)-like protein
MFMKRVIAITKLRIFDESLSIVDDGSEGYEKPENAHIAKMKNSPANENRVYRDSFVRGENVRNENVETSTMNSGRKNSSLNRPGEGGIGG